MKTKFKFTVIALALVLIMSVAAVFAINFKPAEAAGSISVSGSNVFTASEEANVLVDKQTDGDKDVFYTMFTFAYNDDSISYRKNLAYNWYEQVTEGEGESATKKVVNGKFNMEIGFKNTDFKKFVITFESQQYSKTEEGKTSNYVMFFPAGADGVKVAVTDDKDKTTPDSDTILDKDHINIVFDQKLEGSYHVTVSNDGNPSVDGNMVNVGGNYAKYSSSSTTPVYPLIFGAEFEESEGETEAGVAKMVLYSLNNQEFIINSPREEGDHYVGGNVTDNTPAVLCLNKAISHLEIGGEVKFDYQLIDVLRSSPSSTLYYYALRYDDYLKSDVNYDDYEDDRFKEVDSDILLDSDKEFYLPSAAECAGFGGAEDFKVDMAVKAYAKVVDTSSNGEESYVFFDWYLEDEHKLKINNYDFIAVGDDLKGVTYNYEAEGMPQGMTWEEICKEYQKKVDKAASNLSAGSQSYFYLPSAESLFVENSTPYTNMKLSIYYYSDTQSSNTSLATNNLSINVTKPGSYRFTLYATDVAGNDMYYMEDGKPVKFSSGDVWNIYSDDDRHDKLPWFTFNVDYKGAHFKEKPEKQSTAYVGTNYTSASFEINGVENSYEVKYRLFLFDRAGYYAATKITFSYEEFIDAMDGLFEGEETRKYFKEIKQVSETDEDYEEFKDYGWSTSSTSFTPQDGNAFYFMRAEVTDTQYNTDPVTCSLAVVSSVEAKALKGESEWLKNNVASVILLSVAGVSFVAIILLLVIKPKNKDDIDVQFEKEKSKKKSK